MLDFPLRYHISKIKWKSEFVIYACWESQCGRCIFKTCAFALIAPSKIRDLGYESCSVTPVNRNRSLFLEASVNRYIVIGFYWDPLINIYDRTKKLPTTDFIISTQTGSHEKPRILLIHFFSNIHSFTVLYYKSIYHLKYFHFLSLY